MRTFATVFIRIRHFVAQFLSRTATSNEIIVSTIYILLKLRSKRRLLHKYIGAVAGLAENMAGLRFFCVPTHLVLFLPTT